jgi:chaperone required for assembly of F1-ATPase
MALPLAFSNISQLLRPLRATRFVHYNGSTCQRQVPIATMQVEIDNRYSLLSTSRNERMVFPSEALAVVVASDWESMHDTVDLKRMPMVLIVRFGWFD